MSEILLELLRKQNRNFVSLATVAKLKAADKKVLGIDAKDKGPQLEAKLRPHLGNVLTLLKGSRSTFLSIKLPLHELVFQELAVKCEKGPKSPGQLAGSMPMNKGLFVEQLNRLLDQNRIRLSLNGDYGVRISLPMGGTVSRSPVPIPTPNVASPEREFQTAFEKSVGPSGSARICNIRTILGWSSERFNATLRKLRLDGTIQLHSADVSTMSEEEVRQSFVDENNFFYGTLTWKK